MYERNLAEGYIRGVVEDRPAVITVNMVMASLAVNDFLARLHPYRYKSNQAFAVIGVDLSEVTFHETETEGPGTGRHVGDGDTDRCWKARPFPMNGLAATWRGIRQWWQGRNETRPSAGFSVSCCDEMPDQVAEGILYAIGEEDPWMAALLCPCGCGSTIQLSLLIKTPRIGGSFAARPDCQPSILLFGVQQGVVRTSSLEMAA